MKERALLARARALAGRTLGEIAKERGVRLPPDTRRHKGAVGELVEKALGARGGSRDVVDFPSLGVEVKTIPIDARGRPRESTFVCAIDLREVGDVEWERSRVRTKLARVLFVPVEADPSIALAHRRIGTAVRFTLGGDVERALAADYALLAGTLGRGDVERLTARLGTHLQVRPKAAHGRERTLSAGDGADDVVSTVRKGFYLRASFTRALLAGAFP